LEIIKLEKSNNNLKMKNLLLFLLISTTSFAQNKKKQIEILNFRVDSLNTVLATTRDNSAKNIILLNDYIKKVRDELTNLQTSNNKLSKDNKKFKTDLGELTKENEKFKTDLGELSKKNLELEAKLEAVELKKTSFKTVKIGNQVWMAENLDVATYRNGDVIPQVQDPYSWWEDTTGAWCYYDNDASNGTKYGKLYNWYAVNDPRGLAPKGYHIPSDAEWTQLDDYLGGESKAGTKMKSTRGWLENGNGTNSSGFSGLPGGYRSSNASFFDVGDHGFWWSSTDASNSFSTRDAINRGLDYDNGNVDRNSIYKEHGFSVRCLRD
jgi:uncharacterized protein (TIGR02145 family)